MTNPRYWPHVILEWDNCLFYGGSRVRPKLLLNCELCWSPGKFREGWRTLVPVGDTSCHFCSVPVKGYSNPTCFTANIFQVMIHLAQTSNDPLNVPAFPEFRDNASAHISAMAQCQNLLSSMGGFAQKFSRARGSEVAEPLPWQGPAITFYRSSRREVRV